LEKQVVLRTFINRYLNGLRIRKLLPASCNEGELWISQTSLIH